mmetsp:Transcript_37336/g.105423  ORF Transcript_37336/g.105423 Transcript_37336/m.105423 type:complete len:282 (-) Transcript_37336:200-1045(-)
MSSSSRRRYALATLFNVAATLRVCRSSRNIFSASLAAASPSLSSNRTKCASAMALNMEAFSVESSRSANTCTAAFASRSAASVFRCTRLTCAATWSAVASRCLSPATRASATDFCSGSCAATRSSSVRCSSASDPARNTSASARCMEASPALSSRSGRLARASSATRRASVHLSCASRALTTSWNVATVPSQSPALRRIATASVAATYASVGSFLARSTWAIVLSDAASSFRFPAARAAERASFAALSESCSSRGVRKDSRASPRRASCKTSRALATSATA